MALAFDVNILVVEAVPRTPPNTSRAKFAFRNAALVVYAAPNGVEPFQE
jgi:hypothetical protein